MTRETAGRRFVRRANRNGLRFRRGAYLLPSLFTIGNMLLGFYALVMAFRGSRMGGHELADPYFVRAALAVFIAGILDTLDGKIARMMGTDSDFGREYDSLADLFTFGAVPALMTHFWGLYELGRIGWLIPLYYMVCTATRLARFNVQTKVTDSRYFVGLPSPAAAGAVCSLLFYVPGPEWRDLWSGMMLATLATVGTLEVTTFRYWSLKQIDFKRRWSYRAALPLALIILVIAFEPKAFFLAVAIVYGASGPLAWVAGRLRRKPDEDETDATSPAHRDEGEEPSPTGAPTDVDAEPLERP